MCVVFEILLICGVSCLDLGSQELQQKSAALLQRKEELERRRKQIQKESKKVRDAEDLCGSDVMSAFSRVEGTCGLYSLTDWLVCLRRCTML
jgi:hypothetical protein